MLAERSVLRANSARALLFCAALAAAPAALAADASEWSPSAKSRARLVAAGGATQGVYAAGVEIALDGHALTYWRAPGDAGVPPSFDFAGSENVASVQVLYPAPERHDEGGAQAFGWRKEVIFPLVVTPKDPAMPATLALHLNYAACENICVPAEGRARLRLEPAAAPGPHAPRIAAWRARTPKPLGEGWKARFDIEPLAGAKKPAWRVTPRGGAAGDDLFAEGPEGWYFDTKRLDVGFKLVLAEQPAGAKGPAPVRLTHTGAAGAVEFETRLDAERTTP